MAEILLSKKNLFHNLELISKQAKSKEKVAIVLKDNAYGHGLKEIATLAQEFGVKKAVVRNEQEAQIIKENFDYILILAQEEIQSYSPSFHITLNSMENISLLPKNSKVHIKVDTGMHRNGIHPNELEEAFHGLLKRDIQITGVFTHHKSADTLSSEFFWQNEIFKQVKSRVLSLCEQLKLAIPSFHSSNSSALFRHNNFDEDFARVGIATYGYLETNIIYKNPPLKPVLSLWANKMATREIKAGQRVGYGGGFTASKDLVISTYDIGYGDGFLRINENQTFQTYDKHNLLGRVSMDNSSFDTKEKKICIFKDAKDLAKLHGTISYEIITTLSKDIKKTIV